MKPSIFRSSFVLASSLALVLLSGHAFNAADASGSCARLTDAKSPFRDSFNKLSEFQAMLDPSDVQEFDFAPWERAFTALDSFAPWFSQCAANVNVASIALAVSTSEKFNTCVAQLDSADMPDEPSNALFTDYICPLYKDTLVLCINDVLVNELIVPAMESAEGDCCRDMKNVILESFGTDLPTMVDSLTKLVGNALCSTKTFMRASSGESITQTCGYALVAAFESNVESSDSLEPVFNALQIPNDQVCAAVTGQQFTLTSGEPAVFQTSVEDGSSYGICYQTMSDLVDKVSAYPLTKALTVTGPSGTVIPLSDFFGDKTCVPAYEFLMGLLSEDSFLMEAAAVLDEVMRAFDNSIGNEVVGGQGSAGNEFWYGDEGSVADSDSYDDYDHGSGNDAVSSTGSDSEAMVRKLSPKRVLRSAAMWLISIESYGSEASGGEDESSSEGDWKSSDSSSSDDYTPPFGIDAIAALNTTAGYVGGMSADLCLHFPHGVVCDYSDDESIELVYPEVASSTAEVDAVAHTLDIVKRRFAGSNVQKALRAAVNRLRRAPHQ